MEVIVNGEPLKLFLDLGGYQPISLTAAEMARAKVSLLPRVTRFRNSAGEAFEAKQFIAHRVTIAGFDLGDLDGGEALYSQSNAPPDRNGYIGRPAVDRYLLVLDYPNGRVRLYSSGDDGALSAECGTRRFRAEVIDGVVRTIAETEFGPRVLLWDTGATHNVIRPAMLPPSAPPGTKIDEGSPVTELKHVVLGGYDVGPQQFRLIAFEQPPVDGYLGAGLLSSHKVCLDMPRNIGAIL